MEQTNIPPTTPSSAPAFTEEEWSLKTTVTKEEAAAVPVDFSLRGKKRDPPFCRATQTTPRWDLIYPIEPLAVDIEFQRILKDGKWTHRIGRIAVVNSICQVILDVYARYPVELGCRIATSPEKFLVDFEDLEIENGAQHAADVEAWCKEMFNGHNIVFHGGKSDRTAFYIEKDVFKDSSTYDTQEMYSEEQADRTPGLRTLAMKFLDIDIQQANHQAVEDAQTTMRLALRSRPWDRDAKYRDFRAKNKQYSGPAEPAHFAALRLQRTAEAARGSSRGRGGRGGQRGRGNSVDRGNTGSGRGNGVNRRNTGRSLGRGRGRGGASRGGRAP